MSNEEKKAIERLIIYKDKIKDELYPIIDFEEEKAIGIVLNLIEKQQKEIEELKEKNMHITKETVDFINSHYIHKDKIKAKIEEIQNMYDELPKNPKEHLHSRTEYLIVIGELQSLLEKEDSINDK